MRYLLGFGSNVGDRRAALVEATESLERHGVRVLRHSDVYETQPVGGPPGQPPYLNQVIEAEASLEPGEILELVQHIERDAGRDRAAEERWGPRVLDIDILVAGDLVVNDDDLVIPHPRIAERAFVLVPLADLVPDTPIPGLGTPRQMLARLTGTHGVRPARA